MLSRGLGVLAALVLLAGCGGGGGGSVAPSISSSNSGSGSGSGGSTPGGPVATESVTLTILVPKASGTSSVTRRPAYIDSNTQSMTLTLLQVNGAAVTGAAVQGPFNMTTGSPNCVSGANGLTCTYTISAPVGSDIFVANTYSGQNAGGTMLGSGSVALTILSNGRNVANLTLQGPIASVEMYMDTTQVTNETDALRRQTASTTHVRTPSTTGGFTRTFAPPSSAPIVPPAIATTKTVASTGRSTESGPGPTGRIFIVALDVNGNQIINPTTYDIPLTLTLTLNGLPPGVVALQDVYAFPGTGPASESTSSDGGTVTVTSPGDTITMSLTNQVFGSGSPYVTLTYTPQAGPDAGQLQTVGPISYDVTAIQPIPYLEVSETHNDPLSAGVNSTLTINVFNGGNVATSGTVTLVDTLPASFTYVSGSGTGWTCPATATSTVTCTYATSIGVFNDASPLSIVVTPTTTTGSPFTNALSVTGGGATNTATTNDTINVVGAVILTGITQILPSIIYANVPFTQGLEVVNSGVQPSSGTITLTDTLPSGYTYVSGGGAWNCSAVSNVVTCTYAGAIAANGGSSTFSILVQPNTTYDSTETFSVSGSGGGSANFGPSTANTFVEAPFQFTGTTFPTGTANGNTFVGNTDQAALEIGALPTSTLNGTITITTLENYSGALTYSPSFDTCSGSLIDMQLSEFFPASFSGTNSTLNLPIGINASQAGTCSVTFGADSYTVTLQIAVDQNIITIQSKSRKP